MGLLDPHQCFIDTRRALIEKNGNADIHRLYLIEYGTHLDGWVGDPKYDADMQLRWVMLYAHQAFDMLRLGGKWYGCTCKHDNTGLVSRAGH